MGIITMTERNEFKCPTCSKQFTTNYEDLRCPIYFSECGCVICKECSGWNMSGGAGSSIGHYKGRERGTAYCTVCDKPRFHDEGASQSSDDDAAEIRFAYEV